MDPAAKLIERVLTTKKADVGFLDQLLGNEQLQGLLSAAKNWKGWQDPTVQSGIAGAGAGTLASLLRTIGSGNWDGALGRALTSALSGGAGGALLSGGLRAAGVMGDDSLTNYLPKLTGGGEAVQGEEQPAPPVELDTAGKMVQRTLAGTGGALAGAGAGYQAQRGINRLIDNRDKNQAMSRVLKDQDHFNQLLAKQPAFQARGTGVKGDMFRKTMGNQIYSDATKASGKPNLWTKLRRGFTGNDANTEGLNRLAGGQGTYTAQGKGGYSATMPRPQLSETLRKVKETAATGPDAKAYAPRTYGRHGAGIGALLGLGTGFVI